MTTYDNLPNIIDECPICLDNTTVYTGIYNCMHHVCKPCGVSWTMNCPMCRADGIFYEPPIEEWDNIENYPEYIPPEAYNIEYFHEEYFHEEYYRELPLKK